jgi:hypothetical protein
MMDALVASRPRILVRQVKEWGEILVGFEAKNRFELLDASGQMIGRAAEEGDGLGAMFLRNIFGRCRAAKIHLYDRENRELGRGVKPFRWFFHRMEVFEGERKLGAVQRRWSWLDRRFTLEDAQGNELLTIRSPLFRIWTFKLLLRDVEVGRISKEWGGALRELFTDADTFGVEFTDASLPLEIRKLLLVATFLIDFTCFENNAGSGIGWPVTSE